MIGLSPGRFARRMWGGVTPPLRRDCRGGPLSRDGKSVVLTSSIRGKMVKNRRGNPAKA